MEIFSHLYSVTHFLLFDSPFFFVSAHTWILIATYVLTANKSSCTFIGLIGCGALKILIKILG